jgi:hypothetical protein
MGAQMPLFMKQYDNKKDINKSVNWLMKKNYWGWVSSCQTLSEKFIDKHKDKIWWSCISHYQKLSEEFIEKYEDKVVWYWIFQSQKLSPKFREKWRHKCD